MYEKVQKLTKVLESRAMDLDITESRYLEAKKRYEGVGEWLSKDDSTLAQYKPVIFPQGSFRLGTVIKPISNKDEYDIDLVCYLHDLRKNETSQRELKKIVGGRLAQNDIYKKLLDEEGRRCWTLNYENEFHMDILPSIADEEMRKKGEIYKDAILITDKKRIESGDVEWPKSNPIGYADWFFGRQKVIFQEMKRRMAATLKKDIEEVPDYKIKTPLQRTVRLLKRHRDIYFSQKKRNDKPISIIITTISALLYEGQDNVFNAIYDILYSIQEHLFIREGLFYLPNPANIDENFAEKWNENPNLPRAFFKWVKNAQESFSDEVLQEKDDVEMIKFLNESLGFQANSSSYSASFINFEPIHVKTTIHSRNKPWKRA